MRTRMFRSYLYVPAHQPERIEKAYASAADAVVLDLEDAVPASAKVEARANAAALLRQGPSKPTLVRINGYDTPWGRDDVEAVTSPALLALRVPKCESVSQIRALAELLDVLACPARLQIMLETSLGVERALELALASPRVERIGLGESDLRADLGLSESNPTLDLCRARCVTAARAAGIAPPIQTVYPRFQDTNGLRHALWAAKDMGYFGAFAIHPSQLEVINQVFTPGADELRAARELVAAAAPAAGEGACSSVFVLPDGRLVAPPLLAHARALLNLSMHVDQTRSVAP